MEFPPELSRRAAECAFDGIANIHQHYREAHEHDQALLKAVAGMDVANEMLSAIHEKGPFVSAEVTGMLHASLLPLRLPSVLEVRECALEN